MIKVKIFTEYIEYLLCDKINKWISDDCVNVVDMKYSNVSDQVGRCFYTILVMYKEF